MADLPDQLTLARNRDRESSRDVLIRRTLVALIGIVVLLGLLNAFGQRPSTSRAATSKAELEVYAPARVRGGLSYMARFTIRAHDELKNATLVLDPGWAEGITINTIEPPPLGEGSEDGRLVLELGHVPAGKRHVLFVHMQVNPTNVGRRSQDVELRDGHRTIATIDRTITVFS